MTATPDQRPGCPSRHGAREVAAALSPAPHVDSPARARKSCSNWSRSGHPVRAAGPGTHLGPADHGTDDPALALSLAEWYSAEVPFYSYRHIVRPGITGWAQVNQGNVASPEAARLKLEYDFFYIKNFSFWLDVIIVVKTLRTILTGFGSR